MWGVVVMMGCLVGAVSTNYPMFDINTQMRTLLLPADARIGSVIYRLRATDSDRDYPLIFAATDYGSYVIRIDNLPCNSNSSYCEANVFLERSLVPDQIFKFRITVRDTKGDTTTIPVSIKVTNGVTDFNEVFPHIPGVVMIPEDTKVGTELEYVIVKKHPRSLRQASLELWGSSEFKFQQSSKKDTTTGVIKLASSLDYETKTMYKLSVFATGMWVDMATDSRNVAGFQLVVVVTDIQDTPPVFDPIEPITKLNPNLTEGDVVMRVTARDGDKGSPRPVKYGLVSEGNPFTVFFNIDQDSGDIRLARPLKELNTVSTSHQPILLTVLAEEIIPTNTISDKEEDQELISTTATVALLLEQLENSPPYFESHKYVTHLAENSPQGTALVFGEPYVTEVRDNDLGKYGVFSLTLEKNNGTFEISPTVGERQASFIIRVRDYTLLDYEINKQVNFKIWAKELNPNQKSLSASADVIVHLTDENDNPPVFLQDNYSADVAENSTAATRLVKFEATDQDTGEAGVVKYTKVLGLKNTSLSLHPDTGILSIATDSHGFDREESSSYQFFIEARDMKGVGNKATVPFILHVIDVNDETPVFEKNPLDFILGPDGTNFTQRAFIKAIDADAEPPNNVVRYEIVRGNYGNRFILDAETGELLVNPKALMRFARQAKESVTDLLVRAYDMGIPTLWSTVQVRIFPAESSARVMRFLVPGRNPDRRTVEQLLADLTGARVVIHSIEPYIPGHNYYAARATDLTKGSTNSEKSIVTATVLYNNGAIVDLDKLQKHLADNRTTIVTPTTVDDSVVITRYFPITLVKAKSAQLSDSFYYTSFFRKCIEVKLEHSFGFYSFLYYYWH
uniref:Putative cadherin egf lag seven-pass g-type receptor n=1 Tax=Panstrongylus lignarius TaxID=156445 RepID=A0A224X735_9HEMI